MLCKHTQRTLRTPHLAMASGAKLLSPLTTSTPTANQTPNHSRYCCDRLRHCNSLMTRTILNPGIKPLDQIFRRLFPNYALSLSHSIPLPNCPEQHTHYLCLKPMLGNELQALLPAVSKPAQITRSSNNLSHIRASPLAISSSSCC
jgi:hypothetical protein